MIISEFYLYAEACVVSRNNVPPGDKVSSDGFSELMKKLNGRKIRWICREFEKGRISICRIAKMQKITPQHVRRVYKKYKGLEHPKLLPCGRKPKPIKPEEVELILAARKDNPDARDQIISDVLCPTSLTLPPSATTMLKPSQDTGRNCRPD